MTSLVAIPWQPYYLVRPELLTLLEAASRRRGHDLMLYHSDPRGFLSAWRSHAMQAEVYDGYLHHHGPVASSPDVGPRSHMRGTAVDLSETDRLTQSACRAVGLIRDPVESWHWNLPGFLGYPIIPDLRTAGLGTTPIPTTTGADDMAFIRTRKNRPPADNSYNGMLVTPDGVVQQFDFESKTPASPASLAFLAAQTTHPPIVEVTAAVYNQEKANALERQKLVKAAFPGLS